MNGLKKVLEIILTLFARNVKSYSTDSEKSQTAKETMTSENIPDSNIEFKNDSNRLKEEMEELKIRNKPLYNILLDCGEFCDRYFNKKTIVTMIYRTDEEQDSIYKNDPKYQQRKFKSPHQFYHAFDLRSSHLDTIQIEKLVKHLNDLYNKDNYYKWTAKDHDVGLGNHFHVQFVKK
jgi:hypothetical protein